MTVLVDRAIDATRTPLTIMLPEDVWGAPVSPTPVLNVNQGDGSVTATWNQTTPDATFLASWRVGDADFGPEVEVSGTSMSVPVTVGWGDSVTFRVRAVIGDRHSDYGVAVAQRRPATPNLSGSLTAPDQVTFTWDASYGATAYEVRVRTGDGSWSHVTLTGDVLSHAVAASPAVVIGGQVRAIGTGEPSDWSNLVEVMAAPASPSLEGQPVGTTFARFTWAATDGATAFEFRSRVAGGDWVNQTFPLGTLSADVNAGTSGVAVEAQVRAIGESGPGPWSDTVQVITTVPRPGNVTLAQMHGRTAHLAWSAVPGAVQYRVNGPHLPAGGLVVTDTRASFSLVGIAPISQVVSYTVTAIGAAGTESQASLPFQFQTPRNNAWNTTVTFLPGAAQPAPNDGAAVDSRFSNSLVSANGRFAFVVHANSVAVWDLETGQMVRQTQGVTGTVESLRWGANGNLALWNTQGQMVRETQTGGRANTITMQNSGVLRINDANDVTAWNSNSGNWGPNGEHRVNGAPFFGPPVP